MKRIKKLIIDYDFFKKNEDYVKTIFIEFLEIKNFFKDKKGNLREDLSLNNIEKFNNYIKNLHNIFPNVKNFEINKGFIVDVITDKLCDDFFETSSKINIEYFFPLETDNDGNIIKNSVTKIGDLLSTIASKNEKKDQDYKNKLHNYIKTKYRKQLFEPFLLNSNSYTFYYYVTFLNIIDDEIEKTLSESPNISNYYDYIIKIKNQRNKKLEKKFDDLNYFKKNIKYIIEYIIKFIPIPYDKFEKKLLNNLDVIVNDEDSSFLYYNYIIDYLAIRENWSELNFKLIDFIGKIKYDKNNLFKDVDYNIIRFFQGLRKSKKIDSTIISKLDEKIMKDSKRILIITQYIIDVRKKRWKEMENFLFDVKNYEVPYETYRLFDYIKKFKIKDRLPEEFMNKIKSDPRLSVEYAIAIKEAVPELEPTIARNQNDSYRYAVRVLKARFPLGEKRILKSRKRAKYIQKFNIEI